MISPSTYNESKEEAHTLVEEVKQLGREILLIKADFRDQAVVDQIVHSVSDQFGRLKILVNNASEYLPSPIDMVDEQAYFQAMRINSYVPLALIQAFRSFLSADYDPENPQSTGRVINFVDTHIIGKPLPQYVSYNASKAALLEITRTCARELAPAITVNAIAPGVVAWSPSYSEEKRREILQRIPLEHAGTPEDVARAVRYLVNDGHYCSGEVMRLDGGYYLT